MRRWEGVYTESASLALGHLSTPAPPSQVPPSPLALWQSSHAVSGKGIPHLPLATLKAEAVSLCFLRSVPSTSMCDTVLSLAHPFTKGLCLGGDRVCSSPCSWPGPTSSLFLPSKQFFVFVLFSRVRKAALSGSCRAPHVVYCPSPTPFCSHCSGCLSSSSELRRQ